VSQALKVTRTKFTGKRIPGLDGLRGVAILMVLILHFYNEGIINAGYPLIGPVITKLTLSGLYGVQLFFVLSGFLITGILLGSRNDPNYFRNFYMRRFLRIFPLYYGTLCLLFLVLPHVVAFDEAAKDISSRQVWLWTYLSNAPWMGRGWDSSAIFRLGHFWSLCVEEHYYIVWPLVVFKCESPRKIIRLCLLCIGIGFLIRAIHAVVGSPELFTWSSVANIDGLALGSLLAAGLRTEASSRLITRHAPHVALFAGATFLILLFVPRRLHTGYYWMIIETISVTFFGGVLILVLRQTRALSALMRNQVLIAFGKYSYGIYVIHNICLPLFQWLFNPKSLSTKLGSPLLAQAVFYVLAISASFLFAFMSWHLCESHFLKLKRFFEYDRKFGPVAVDADAEKHMPSVA